jgi:hypothetical protein
MRSKIAEIEKKAKAKPIKVNATRAQQMLLLQKLGFFDTPYFKSIASTKKKAKLLSFILNASADNIEGDLTGMNAPSSPLRIAKNYELLIKTFEQAGLSKLAAEADKELTKILNEKDKKKIKNQ